MLLPAEVGSVHCGVPRGASWLKKQAESCLAGETAPPFSFVPGKFVSSALLRARQVALLPLTPPHPASPGAGLAWLGTGSQGPGLGPCDCRPEPAWVPGKVRGVAAVVVCAGREVASGDLGRWAGGPVGEWSRALVGSSAEVGEGLVGSVPLKWAESDLGAQQLEREP